MIEPPIEQQAQSPIGSAACGPPPDRRVKSRWWMKLLALFVGLLASCLTVEVLVLLIIGEQPKFPRHVVRAPWGLRYNEPGSHYRHKSADMTAFFRINRQGMRADRDFIHAKPAGVQRIVSLGDSFTIGYEVDADACFSSVLETELREAGFRAEVLNAGVSGFSTAEEALYLERELIKYAPDLVLVSFYGNDFEDNVRSHLFRLDGQGLVAQSTEYVPAGPLGDYLNTSWFFNLLSERSNAFVLVKERLTLAMKRSTVERNQKRIDSVAAQPKSDATAAKDYAVALTAAIFERMYGFLSARRIPLVIQSIPDILPAAPGVPHENRQLGDLFPLGSLDVRRPGLYYASAKTWLDPYRGRKLLYWKRSHWHWTPAAHRISGQRLARLIVTEGLLKQASKGG